MKLNNYSSLLGILIIFAILLVSCSKRIEYCYCNDFANKDSLIQCIITNYDADAYKSLLICHEDSNMNLYGFLVADSSGIAGWYIPIYNPDGSSSYNLSDTVTLFYEIKGLVMGCGYFDENRQRRIDFPDSIYTILKKAYWYPCISADDKETYAKEFSNLDSLYNITLSACDISSYNKLRRLMVPSDSLLSAAVKIANQTHYPIACYDVYDNSARGVRLSQEYFDFAYSYLCEAADSMYYPAVFLKACLCLTGVYFPQDTLLGKKLLEQCHATTTIPFWQQYSKPVVYRHLLHKSSDDQ